MPGDVRRIDEDSGSTEGGIETFEESQAGSQDLCFRLTISDRGTAMPNKKNMGIFNADLDMIFE